MTYIYDTPSVMFVQYLWGILQSERVIDHFPPDPISLASVGCTAHYSLFVLTQGPVGGVIGLKSKS